MELFFMSDFFFVIWLPIADHVWFSLLFSPKVFFFWIFYRNYLWKHLIQLETVRKCFLPRITGKVDRFCFCHMFSRLRFFRPGFRQQQQKVRWSVILYALNFLHCNWRKKTTCNTWRNMVAPFAKENHSSGIQGKIHPWHARDSELFSASDTLQILTNWPL